jgi:serine/threonine protein kinase
MCKASFDPEHIESLNIKSPDIRCVLGDFSSAYDDFTRRNLYVDGPSRAEQTDEYAPPEAIFGTTYNKTSSTLTTAFDSWSIGIVALELLLGSPNVFSVDQRTR